MLSVQQSGHIMLRPEAEAPHLQQLCHLQPGICMSTEGPRTSVISDQDVTLHLFDLIFAHCQP